MRDVLDDQIDVYNSLHDDIVREHGRVWVVVAEKQVKRTFSDFSLAAHYVAEHFPTGGALIRDTAEVQETAPYVHIGA